MLLWYSRQTGLPDNRPPCHNFWSIRLAQLTLVCYTDVQTRLTTRQAVWQAGWQACKVRWTLRRPGLICSNPVNLASLLLWPYDTDSLNIQGGLSGMTHAWTQQTNNQTNVWVIYTPDDLSVAPIWSMILAVRLLAAKVPFSHPKSFTPPPISGRHPKKLKTPYYMLLHNFCSCQNTPEQNFWILIFNPVSESLQYFLTVLFNFFLL